MTCSTSTLTDEDLFKMAEAHTNAAMLHFALHSRLFEYINSPQTEETVSVKFGWVLRKTTVLLNALVALNLAIKKNNQYQASPIVQKRLLKNSTHYIGSYIELRRIQWSIWSNLSEILSQESHVSGQQRLDDETNQEFAKLFQDAMSQVCEGNIKGLSDLKIWKSPSHVVDLGGGHGLHLSMLLKDYPLMTGEIFDLPAVRHAAELNFNKYEVMDRVGFRECDLNTDFLDMDVITDVIMINHTLHHFNPNMADKIIKKAVSLLKVGGNIVIIDQILLNDGCSPSESAIFSFYLMVSNQVGQLHSVQWITNKLEKLGCAVNVDRCSWNDEDFILTATKLI